MIDARDFVHIVEQPPVAAPPKDEPLDEACPEEHEGEHRKTGSRSRYRPLDGRRLRHGVLLSLLSAQSSANPFAPGDLQQPLVHALSNPNVLSAMGSTVNAAKLAALLALGGAGKARMGGGAVTDVPMASASSQGNAIILYDGVCNLCNASIRFILARDHEDYVRFAPLQSDIGRTLAAQYDLTPDLSTFFLIDGGKAYEKSLAWLEIMRLLGKPWSAFYFLKRVPGPIRDWVYDFIGRNRYQWFGKQHSCSVPKAEWQGKFL